MNVNFVPSLKQITLNKLAIDIISKNSLLFSMSTDVEKVNLWFEKYRNVIAETIKNYSIPDSTKFQLLGTVKEIAIKIQYWAFWNGKINLFYTFLMKHFHLIKWTPYGNINDVETAKTLLALDCLDLDMRYYLACYYSLQDYIYQLRPQIDRLRFSQNISLNKMVNSQVSVYWQSMKDLHPVIKNFGNYFSYKDLYLEALELMNLSSMKYFYKKLSRREKRLVRARNLLMLSHIIKGESLAPNPTELFIFILKRSRFSTVQLYASEILTYFLTWPLQSFFYVALEHLFEYITPEGFSYLMTEIGQNCLKYWVYFDYPRAYEIVLGKGTDCMKREFFNKICNEGDEVLSMFMHK